MLFEKIHLEGFGEHVWIDTYVADHVSGYIAPAILICPGGGYGAVCHEREGEAIAMAFLPHGFNCFVLHYSVRENNNPYPAHLIEASAAMKYLRDNAERFNIDPERIFVSGFSAGGHLAAMLGTQWQNPAVYEALEMPYGYNKPAGLILGYPVITGDMAHAHQSSIYFLFCKDSVEAVTPEEIEIASLERHVTKDTPPAFIFHTANDDAVPVENSLRLAAAYNEAKVPFELHIYPRGAHGIALANKLTNQGRDDWYDERIQGWVALAAGWAKEVK